MNSSEPVGTVRALWRFPVKSMLGEELDAADLSEGGIVGDRAYAIRDRETGKVASAKHPKLWPDLLACRAAFVEPPRPGDELPPVRIELADGDSVLSDAADVDAVLSRFFGRDVELARAAQNGYTIDQYHPDEENYDPEGHRDEVVEARLGAAFFNEREHRGLDIDPEPSEGLDQTAVGGAPLQHHRPQKSEQRLARVLGLQQCVPIVDDPAEPVLDDRRNRSSLAGNVGRRCRRPNAVWLRAPVPVHRVGWVAGAQGTMLWLPRKRLCGSTCRLTATSRSRLRR